MLVNAQEYYPILCRTCIFSLPFLSLHCYLWQSCILSLFYSCIDTGLCCILVLVASLVFLGKQLCFLLHHPAHLVHHSPPQMAINALTSLSDHKLARVALKAIVVYFDLKVNSLTIRVSCLHARVSRLIWIQSVFNPHPEVGYVIRIPILVKRVYTYPD